MEVQQNLLPSGPPTIPGLDIAGRSVYCQETGGDYYDYIPLAGRRAAGCAPRSATWSATGSRPPC